MPADSIITGVRAVDRAGASACPRCHSDSEAIACPRCATIGAGRYCTACGSLFARGPAWRRALRALFEPLFEYFEHIRWLIHPRELAEEVREGHFNGVELIGFWVAAVLVGALLTAFVPAAEGEHVELPIMLEAAQALWLMARTAIVFAPAHLLLRMGHRHVTLRQYLLSTLTIAALLYPWVQFAQAVAKHWLPGDPAWWILPFTLTFYAAGYAALYRRRLASALPIFVAYVAAVVAVGVGALWLTGRITPAATHTVEQHDA